MNAARLELEAKARECASRLYPVALAFRRRDRAAADDLVQETFLEAWRAIDGFEHRSDLLTWLRAILVRRALRHRRVSFDGLEPGGVVDTATGPELTATASEARARMWVAIDRLPEAERTVVLLRYLEDLSGEEIAQIVGTSHARVRSRLSEARQRLREALIASTPTTDEPTCDGART